MRDGTVQEWGSRYGCATRLRSGPGMRKMVDDSRINVGRAGVWAGTGAAAGGSAYFQRTQIDGVRQADVESESKLQCPVRFSLRLEGIAPC